MLDSFIGRLDDGRRKWLALAVIVAAQFMVVLDIAIVNVALPSIRDDLHFAQENLQWVVSAYAILFGGALLLGGPPAAVRDRSGHLLRRLAALRPVLVGGLADRLPGLAGAGWRAVRPGCAVD